MIPPGLSASRGYQVMAKPAGPACNLACSYCHSPGREKLFPPGTAFRMREDVLERYIRQQIESQDGPDIVFTWQGGEPTLLGVDYFRAIVALQARHAAGKTIHNALQTNAVLIDHAWAGFLAEHRFLVGVSLDGPRALHDTYRVDTGGKPTFERVMRGLELLRRHGAEFTTLTVVSATNVKHPLTVYGFLKETGARYLQFIPLVERLPAGAASAAPFTFAGPHEAGGPTAAVTRWSVQPEAYGEFLVQIFDAWVRDDVGRHFVQLFDVALAAWAGLRPGLCVFEETCGRTLAVEHNGDVFSCEHYVYPRQRLGNLLNDSLGAMVDSPRQRAFGEAKRDTLPRACRECDVRFACHGECPRHRFARTPDGEEGLNYLCAAYKRFFHHVDPAMRTMAALLHRGRAPAEIMRMAA